MSNKNPCAPSNKTFSLPLFITLVISLIVFEKGFANSPSLYISSTTSSKLYSLYPNPRIIAL